MSTSQLQHHLSYHSFIHSASQVPVTIPDAGDLKMNTGDKISCHQGVHIVMHERETENIHITY